ncbi:MAG: hypothetical protein O7C65_05870 [Planctomycetota bacterium]|nr:hypothetical protein [Planctomycetota bacterium]
MPQPQEEVLRVFLTDRDVPCPVCRYNLRGLGSTTCPECGVRLDLRVGSIDLKLGPWLLCVLAVAIPMGFTGILAIIASIGAQRSAFWGLEDWIALGGLWAMTLAYAVALTVLSKRRSRFLRRSPAGQWWRAGLWTAVMILSQAGTIWLISWYL